MASTVQNQASSILRTKKNHKRWLAIVICLAVVVAIGTVAVLTMPGVAMTHQDKVLDCPYEDAGYPVAHTHNDDCYDGEGNLVCGLPELEEHVHDASCYTQEQCLICGLEESEAHTHDESCYETVDVLTCDKVETVETHVHGADCFKTVELTPEEVEALNAPATAETAAETPAPVTAQSTAAETAAAAEPAPEDAITAQEITPVEPEKLAGDPNADVETASDWSAMFAPVTLTGDWNEDLVAVAKTQIGYTESAANYIVNDAGEQKGYTRYGAWAGSPYANWSAMFVSFCLNYAEIPTAQMPQAAGVPGFAEKLTNKGIYNTGAYEPKSGDLVFVDTDGNGSADHMGIAYTVNKDANELWAIEGNVDNAVKYVQYALNDSKIVGYGVLPEEPKTETETGTATEKKLVLMSQPMPAQDFAAEADGVTVTVAAPEGAFPEGTTMVITHVYDEDTLTAAADAVSGKVANVTAVDITFYDADGEQIQPQVDVQVTIKSDAITGSADVVHVADNGDTNVVQQADVAAADDEVVVVVSDFSVYAVVETLTKEVRTASGETLQATVTVTNADDVARLEDLRVEEFSAYDDAYWKAYDAVVAAKKAEDPNFDESSFGFLPVDITLLDENGEAFEPKGAVSVKLEITTLPADADTLTSTMEVQHLEEKNGAVVAVETVATSDDVTGEGELVTAEFTVSSFSTFTLTWTGDGSTVVVGDDEASGDLNIQVDGETYATVTVHYVDEYGNNIQRPITSSVSGTSPVTLAGLVDKEIEGYEFQDIRYDAYNGAVITTAAAARGAGQTTTTYTEVGTTRSGRNNAGKPQNWTPSTSETYYGDVNGVKAQIYYENVSAWWWDEDYRFRTLSGDIYSGGTVYTLESGTEYPYTLTLTNGETEVATLTQTTSGTWTDAADIYVVYKSTNTDLKHATVHFGSLNADGSFTELEESTSIDTNAASINLDTTILPNYEYVGAYYCTAATAAPADDGTAINSVLRSVEDQWQYTASNPEDDGSTPTGFLADGSHIYVSYMPKTTPSSSTPSDADIPTPETVKNVTDNGDGTYNIQLDIIGQEITSTSRKGANVLIIFDRTSSMSNGMSGAANRFEAAKSAVRTLVTALDPATNPVELAVFSFDRNANTPYSANGSYWTTSGSAITGFTDALTMAPSGATPGYGGTNWEAAFTQAATVLATADNDPTYVIFLTDGNPTIYVGSNNIVTANENSPEYTRARTAANNLDTKYKIYGILCANQSDGPLLQTLVTYLSNNGHDASHILANNATTLTNTFKDIADYVVSQLGASDVSTNDGVTSLSDVSATVNGAAGAFEYYKAYLVTQKDDGKYYYNDEDGKEHEVAAADVQTYEYLDAEGNEVSYQYYNRRTWTDYAAASYNKATGVTWNLSSEGTLSAGSIYSVSFTVWPSQAAYDLLADLNNGIKVYEAGHENSITADERAQVYESGGVYYMKTNTNLDTTYTFGNDTYTDGVEFHQGAMDLDTETISLRKLWPENLLDTYGEGQAQGGVQDSITLTVTRDGDNYMDVTVTKADGWEKDDIYIAPGVMTVHDGKVDLKTTGHDYTVTEPESFSYYWDLIADVYHPMVINGTTTMLILDEDLTDTDVDNATVFKLDGKYYRVKTGENVLEASNHRRSNLNLTKTVTGDNAPADAMFTYTVTVTDVAGEDIWFSAQTIADAAAQRETYQKLEVSSNVTPEYRTVAGATYNATDETYTYTYGGKTYTLPAADDGTGGYMYTGYYSVKSGESFTISMKGDWNVRFINLLHGSTYSIEETGMDDGFSYVSTTPSTQFTLTTDEVWNTIDGAKTTGTITEPNNSYKLTYTNKWTTVPFQLKKVGENNETISGAKFDLAMLSGSVWSNTKTDVAPNATANPIDLGGLGTGRYRLTETTAPDGYVILNKNIYFEVYKDGDTLKARFTDENGTALNSMTEATITSSTEDDVTTWLITVSNTAGTALPMTGGAGTRNIITFGITLCAVSALLLAGRVMMSKKRKARGNEGSDK